MAFLCFISFLSFLSFLSLLPLRRLSYPINFAIRIRRAIIASATNSISAAKSNGSHKRCLASVSSAVRRGDCEG